MAARRGAYRSGYRVDDRRRCAGCERRRVAGRAPLLSAHRFSASDKKSFSTVSPAIFARSPVTSTSLGPWCLPQRANPLTSPLDRLAFACTDLVRVPLMLCGNRLHRLVAAPRFHRNPGHNVVSNFRRFAMLVSLHSIGIYLCRLFGFIGLLWTAAADPPKKACRQL